MEKATAWASKSARITRSTSSAGILLNRFGLLFLVAVLLAAGWTGQMGIVALVSLFLAAAGFSKLWSSLSLVGVQCKRSLSESRIFPGETFEWSLRLENRKPLPVPWIRIDGEIPLQLHTEEGFLPGKQAGFGSLRRITSLLWYRSITWRFRLQGLKRGYYPIGSTTITSGDIFGLYARSMTLGDSEPLIVYPRIFPIARLHLPSQQPMGESKIDWRLFQDPARPIGVRDYQSFDSLRHIHWKASARRQGLQVKIFEPTTTFKAALFLSVDSFHRTGAFEEEKFELGISAAASVACHLFERGCPVGLYMNTFSAENGQEIGILPGAGRNQLTLILEALAKTTEKAKGSFEALLERERDRLSAGMTLIIICASPPPSLPGLLRNLKASGHRVLVMLIGEQETIPLEGSVPQYIIRQPGDLGGASCHP